MSNKIPLMAFTAFGRSMEDVIIIAGHPEERFMPDGAFNPLGRSILLRIKDQKALYIDEVGFSINRSWMSENGSVYCTAIQSDKIFTYKKKKWDEEKYSPRQVEAVNSIFGLSGKEASKDRIYLTTNDNIFFTRIDGKWEEHVPPVNVTLLYNPYGITANEIYIGGSRLFMWDGSELIQLDEPETDSLSALYITKSNNVIGGDNSLHISNDDGGWDEIKSEYSDFTRIVEFQKELYAATYDSGIIKIYPGKPEAVTDQLELDSILSLKDGLIAFGDELVLATYDGKKWFPIKMPECDKNFKF
jgi:hypothetical protein